MEPARNSTTMPPLGALQGCTAKVTVVEARRPSGSVAVTVYTPPTCAISMVAEKWPLAALICSVGGSRGVVVKLE